jgi:hypothetical protein
MNEVHQLANALLTVVFAAAIFVVSHLYIEKRSTRIPTTRHAAQAFVLWTNLCNLTRQHAAKTGRAMLPPKLRCIGSASLGFLRANGS